MKTIEWPKGSGRIATYNSAECALIAHVRAQADAGEITAAEMKNQIDVLHELKVEFGLHLDPLPKLAAAAQESESSERTMSLILETNHLVTNASPSVSPKGPANGVGPVRVTLRADEQAQAQRCAQERFARRRRQGSQHRWNRGGDHSVEKEVEAIGAEMAVAQVIGRSWVDSSAPDKDGDVGAGVQVRHTRYERGKLLLHRDDPNPTKNDDPAHDFFLVTGTYPEFKVVGWINAANGFEIGEVEELQRGRPAVTVTQEKLADVSLWLR